MDQVPAELLGDTVRMLLLPPSEVAANLSRLLSKIASHSALMLVTVDDVERPLKVHGDLAVLDGVTFSELESVRSGLPAGTMVRRDAVIGGTIRSVLALAAPSRVLLVLADPGPTAGDSAVKAVWDVVAARIDPQASEASPTYLLESRAATGARAQAVTEFADRQNATLDSLLAVLRSANLSDRAARQAAVSIAIEAAVNLRTAMGQVLTLTEEPVTNAFERLRDDLEPLIRYRDVDVQFVEPPVDGRALPSEVANGARAVVRSVIVALADQPAVKRVRLQWDCDGMNLLINVRDDGPGELTLDSPHIQLVRRRVTALNGSISMAGTSGWGSEMSVIVPLDPPQAPRGDPRLSELSRREREVMAHVVAGRRNRDVAKRMDISENTVKFHLASIFKKLAVSSRSELAARVLQPRRIS